MSYSKTWYLMPPCLTFSIIRYESRVSEVTQGKEQCSPLHPAVVAIEKGAFGRPRLQTANTYTHTHIYIYIYIYHKKKKKEMRKGLLTPSQMGWGTVMSTISYFARVTQERVKSAKSNVIIVAMVSKWLFSAKSGRNGIFRVPSFFFFFWRSEPTCPSKKYQWLFFLTSAIYTLDLWVCFLFSFFFVLFFFFWQIYP